MDSLKIAILGQGLGYSLANLLASYGHDVMGVDVKTDSWLKPNIDAPMRSYIEDHQNKIEGNIRYTLNYNDIADSQIVFCFVETPMLPNGRLGLNSVMKATESALKVISQNTIFIMMSTLPVGGTQMLFDKFGDSLRIRYIYIPPMIQKADFLKNYLSPPYLLFGFDDLCTSGVISRMKEFYNSFIYNNPPMHFGPPKGVEVIKLATNAFGLMKGMFFNRLGDYCVSVGIDPYSVCQAVGSHPIIRSEYTTPGNSIGGPCLPRDVKELYNNMSSDFSDFLKQVEKYNYDFGMVKK